MLTDEVFLADIREHPDEDAPRLVYADWLTDHDQEEHGELIRVQCRLAKLAADDGERAELEKREEPLRWAYLGSLDSDFRKLIKKPVLRRGFLEGGEVAPTAILRHGEVLFRQTLLREVKLYGNFGEPAVIELTKCPWMAQIESLQIDNRSVRERAITALGESPYVGQIRELWLEHCQLHEGAIQALLQPGRLTRLTTLRLRYTQSGTMDLVALATSPAKMRLNCLDLHGQDGIDENGASALAHSAQMANLTDLTLWVTKIRDAGARAIFRSPHLRQLRRLTLAVSGLTEESLSSLVEPGGLDQLVYLHLGVCNCQGAGAQALANAPGLVGLQHLELYRSSIGDRGAIALANSPYLQRLEYLGLLHNQLTEVGSQAMLDSPGLRSLRKIDLRANEIPKSHQKLWRARLGKEAWF